MEADPKDLTAQPILARLAQWGADFRLDAAGSPAAGLLRHAAVRSILDTIGVTLGGANRETARIAAAHARQQYAPGPCQVFAALPASGKKMNPTEGGLAGAGAAFANAVAAHVLDFDDTCYVGLAHGSAVVLPAALAAGQETGASGLDLLEAFIVGSEIAYQIGALLTDSFYFKGFWNTGVLGAVGAAAAVARIRGLPAPRIADAMALAANQIIGLRACLGTRAKPVLAGRAAETGFSAALLAGSGIDGPVAVLEGANGWRTVLGDGTLERHRYETLGESLVVLSPGVAFKRYPVCSAAQAAVEAVQDLLAENTLNGAAVDRVVCAVTPLVHISLRYPQPATPAESQFSMPFAIGCILAFGALTPAEITPERLADPALRAAMARVHMEQDPHLADDPERLAAYPEGARVTLILHDGRRLTRFQGLATGMPERPLSDLQLETKFRNCAEATLEPEAIETLLARIRHLERQPDLRTLFSTGL